jgi:hypothetical protein
MGPCSSLSWLVVIAYLAKGYSTRRSRDGEGFCLGEQMNPLQGSPLPHPADAWGTCCCWLGWELEWIWHSRCQSVRSYYTSRERCLKLLIIWFISSDLLLYDPTRPIDIYPLGYPPARSRPSPPPMTSPSPPLPVPSAAVPSAIAVVLHRRRPSPWGWRRRRESAWGVLEVPRRHGRWWWRPRGVGEGRRWWGDGPRTILLLRGGIIRRRRRRWWWWWESWIEPVLKGPRRYKRW